MKTEDKLKVLKILTHLPERIKFLGKPDMEYLKRYNITDIYSQDYLNTALKLVEDTPKEEFTQTREDGVLPIAKNNCLSILKKACL